MFNRQNHLPSDLTALRLVQPTVTAVSFFRADSITKWINKESRYSLTIARRDARDSLLACHTRQMVKEGMARSRHRHD